MIHMEQKNYSFEIMNVLLKTNCHVRGLAKKLEINHTTISRKIKELFESNIVDYKREGKNKVYFIKKNPEAKAFIFMTENYKLNQKLKKYPYIRKIIEKIQNNKQITLAIIFGSYAQGTAKKDSDIDIYVETMNKKIKRDLEMIDSKVSIKIGKYDKKSPLIREMEKNHIIIKGVEKYYEKNEFFD